ncbi:LacI family DNA-binding transcriptional regulator [Pelagicoccus mobilis]|uniref:LacI family DNA-binding transcriptional regulator n=1 Tax=Pelagicoccus mobilis TaxID=415221 RepID=A0A934RZ21_9BACT|nr:LacI family DNA-binding transcriptional regulator [Pelagicoccus mobilis]MBK1876459.1 LacI family DNA-binding transcriptional regulator [Pelagicoccus mobilis]
MTAPKPKPENKSDRRVTVREIAAEIGVHFTTVAEALRDSPRVKEATKKKVRETADRMGYQADPMLSALSAYRTQNRTPAFQGILVWINGFETRDFFSKGKGFYQDCYLGAQQRCQELGYKLEPFWMSEPGMTASRASQILHDRNASGVIVGPMPHNVDELNLFWDTFCSVRIGYSLKDSELTNITADQYENARLLYTKLHDFGFKRIGFSCSQLMNVRTNNLWLGGYLAAQKDLTAGMNLTPFLEKDTADDGREFLKWVKEQQPDVIMAADGLRYISLLQKSGYTFPGDMEVVSLHADTPQGDLAGITQNGMNVGIVSVDHLVGIIHRFRVGLETHTKTVAVVGEWKDSPNFKRPSAPSN